MVLVQRADDHVPGRAPVGWRIVFVSAQEMSPRKVEVTPPLGLSDRVPSGCLARFPEQFATLRTDPGLARTAFEEAVR